MRKGKNVLPLRCQIINVRYMKVMNSIRVVILLALVSLTQCLQAQRIKFKEVKKQMIAQVTLNDKVQARALIDTGASMTIIDSTYLVSSGLELNLKECHHAIRMPGIGKVLRCYRMLIDTLDVDGLKSSRPVYVADLRKIAKHSDVVPFDMVMGSCYQAKDGSKMVTLNIADGYISYGKRELPEKKYKKGIMTVDKKGFVGTDAPLRILTRNYKSGQITGRFIIDTGNANYFFLCGKNKEVMSSLQQQGFELRERNVQGKTIHYISMDSAEILGKEISMEKSVLLVLPIKLSGNYAGAIGYKFLKEVELVLDYDNNFLYIR